jgi:hypothetical protein
MMHTAKTNRELRPYIGEAELGGLILSQMKDMEETSFFNFTDLIGFDVQVGEGYGRIVLTVSVSTSAMFNEGAAGDFDRFVTVEHFYAIITIDLENILDEGESNARYATESTISGMSKNEMNIFLAIVDKFNTGEQQIQLTDRADDIGGFMYKQLAEFKESMGESFEFDDGGLYIASLFDLIANAQGDDTPDGETVKAALQGLYNDFDFEFGNGELLSEYNYDASVFYDNPIQEKVDQSNSLMYADYQLG